MKNLDLYDLMEKISDYSSDVEYVDKGNLHTKLVQFWNFINQQSISNRAIENIEKDFKELGIQLEKLTKESNVNERKQFLKSLLTPEKQGAFGFFIIKQIIEEEKDHMPELNYTINWYDYRSTYDESREDFNDLFFKPFIDLLKWYLEEYKSNKPDDYFSVLEIEEYSEKLDTLLLGQEVLFDEIEELKELMKTLKKKNWKEILKGKLFDLAIQKIITLDNFREFVYFITGQDIKMLN